MLTRIGLPDVMREELKKELYKQKGLLEVKRGKFKIHVVHCKIQISFFVGSAIAAKYTLDGEGLAGEGWDIKSEVIAGICTDFSELFFLGRGQLGLTYGSVSGCHLAIGFSQY